VKIDFRSIGGITDLRSGVYWSPDRLENEVEKRAGNFKNRSIGPGHIVAIFHGGTPAFFADLFALWSVGACAACLNPALTMGELENVVSFTGASAVLVGEDATVSQASLQSPVICTEEECRLEDVFIPEGGEDGPDDPAVILFTSGTTGTPKGVVHTFRSLISRIELNRDNIGADMKRTLCTLPTHFGHGLIGNCLTPLFAGDDLFLYGNMGVPEAVGFGDKLVENGITFLSSVPTFWKIVLKMCRPPNRQTLRRVHIGSAPLSAELWSDVLSWSGTENVCNMYGITETANWLAGASADTFEPEDGLVGHMWGGSAAVFDDGGQRQKEGDGELAVQTPGLMRGYLHQDELTRDVISDGWFRTGDSARIDEDGVIRLTGRLKNEINKAGMKIHPEEIDLLLERHPSVVEACAFSVPDSISGELIGVAVHLNGDSETDSAQLKSWCAENIRHDCVPDKWFIVDTIAKTDRGKINRDLVRQDCLPEKAGT